MQRWDWERQCRYAAQVGYHGIEVAPFTLANRAGELPRNRRSALRETAFDAGIEIVGLHWLLVAPAGLHVTSPDERLRHESWDYVVELSELCADLGGDVMIFGSPKQRSSIGISPKEAVANLTEGLIRVAPAIGEHGVRLLLEPLSSDQTDVVNTFEEAVRVIEDVNHPAVSSMFDFHNTADETLPLDQVVRTYADYITHVHVQEKDGRHLGTGDASETFVPVLRALRDVGYDGWISLEVFDFEPGPEIIASESIDALRRMVDRL